MQRWSSDPLAVPRDAAAPFTHANLEFEDVQHDGPSFVVQLVFNNPKVEDAVSPETRGYAGHFTVFGHGECWGDAGHCEVPSGPLHEFDRRPPHPLTPINVTVDVTEALLELPEADAVVVTALAESLDPSVTSNPLRFKRLTLVTFE
jgi:tyrosinase